VILWALVIGQYRGVIYPWDANHRPEFNDFCFVANGWEKRGIFSDSLKDTRQGSEHLKEAVEVCAHGVKFPTQHEWQDMEGQTDHKQGDTDVHGKGEQKDVKLGKDPGQDTQHQVGDQQKSQNRGAESDRKNKHMPCQVHEQGNRLPGEMQGPGWQENIRVNDDLEKDMVQIEGQKDQYGDNVGELTHDGQLLGCLRVKNIGGGKAHLIADDGAAEADGGKDEPGHKAEKQTDQDFVHHDKRKLDERKLNLRRLLCHQGEEQQSGGKGKSNSDLGWSLAAVDHRDCRQDGHDPGETEEESLELFYGDKLNIHGNSGSCRISAANGGDGGYDAG